MTLTCNVLQYLYLSLTNCDIKVNEELLFMEHSVSKSLQNPDRSKIRRISPQKSLWHETVRLTFLKMNITAYGMSAETS